MPWGRVDDTHYDHSKVLDIPRRIRNAADGLYWRAISRCNRTLSDGWLTDGDLSLIDAEKAQIEALVTVGLWERKADGRLRIHDYLVFNKSRAEVLNERRIKSDAGRSGGLASGRKRANQTAKQKPDKREAPASPSVGASLNPRPLPVPTRPDPPGSIEPGAQNGRATGSGERLRDVSDIVPMAGDDAAMPKAVNEPYRTFERLTGTPMGYVSPRTVDRLDGLVIRREVQSCVDAMVAVAPTIAQQPPGPEQLVTAMQQHLEPFVNGAAKKPKGYGPTHEEARRAFRRS